MVSPRNDIFTCEFLRVVLFRWSKVTILLLLLFQLFHSFHLYWLCSGKKLQNILLPCRFLVRRMNAIFCCRLFTRLLNRFFWICVENIGIFLKNLLKSLRFDNLFALVHGWNWRSLLLRLYSHRFMDFWGRHLIIFHPFHLLFRINIAYHFRLKHWILPFEKLFLWVILLELCQGSEFSKWRLVLFHSFVHEVLGVWVSALGALDGLGFATGCLQLRL